MWCTWESPWRVSASKHKPATASVSYVFVLVSPSSSKSVTASVLMLADSWEMLGLVYIQPWCEDFLKSFLRSARHTGFSPCSFTGVQVTLRETSLIPSYENPPRLNLLMPNPMSCLFSEERRVVYCNFHLPRAILINLTSYMQHFSIYFHREPQNKEH